MMETESENESIFEMSEDEERNIKTLKQFWFIYYLNT